MTLGRPTSYSGFPSVGLILLYQHVRFRTPPIPPPPAAAAAAANYGSESKSTNSQTLSVHLAATVTELWGNIQKETPETQANRLGCHNKSDKGTFLCIEPLKTPQASVISRW